MLHSNVAVASASVNVNCALVLELGFVGCPVIVGAGGGGALIVHE
jgi:hypothetical protein